MEEFVLAAVSSHLSLALTGLSVRHISTPRYHRYSMRLSDGRVLIFETGGQPFCVLAQDREERGESISGFGRRLRPELAGAVIVAVERVPAERVLRVTFRRKSLGNRLITLALVAELLPVRANLVLVDSGNRVVAAEKSRQRLEPGTDYKPPGRHPRMSLSEIPADFDFSAEGKEEATIARNISGFSALLAREAIFRAKEDSLNLIDGIKRVHDLAYGSEAGADGAWIYSERKTDDVLRLSDNREFLRLSSFPLKHLSDKTETHFEDLMEGVYYWAEIRHRAGRAERARARVRSQLKRRRKSTDRLGRKLEGELSNAEDSDRLSRYGQLLKSCYGLSGRGRSEISVDDYFDPEIPKVTIPLDPRRTVAENAQRYFHRSRKGARGVARVRERLKRLNAEREYLESQENALVQAEDLTDLESLAAELTGKRPPPKTKAKKDGARPYRVFPLHDGVEVWVGRSGRSNDRMTFQDSGRRDLWFHAEGPGAHVVLRTSGAPDSASEEDILKAAALAAYYSRSRNESWVDVKYTERRFVRKPPGVPAGLVLLEKFKTVRVSPSLPAEESAK